MDRDEIKRRLKALHEDVLLEAQLRDGALHLLQAAKQRGLKLGVASSSSHKWVDGHLARYDLLPFFDAVKCRDDVEPGHSKPYPDLYLAALEALDARADQTIAFEDSLNGVKAAKAAGLYVIAVSNPITQHMQLDLADLLVETFEDVALDELSTIRRAGP